MKTDGMRPSFDELECAACDVIQIVKQTQELKHCRLSVIGGLALQHYLPKYRPTDNINFITNISTSPSLIKKRLLEKPNSPFFQRSQVLFYKGEDGTELQVDISPEWLSPYLPESATNVRDIPQGKIPYISLTDLIVFKLDSAGLRSSPVKKERDARDAAALVEHYRGSISLSPKQEEVAEEALCDVAKVGTKEKHWWERHLRLGSSAGASSSGSVDDSVIPTRPTKGSGNRPHSNSDSVYDGLYRGSGTTKDSNTAWFYERLDRAHLRRFTAMRRTRGAAGTMTKPKTTHASFFRHSNNSSSVSVSVDSSHGRDCNGQYYHLEPQCGSWSSAAGDKKGPTATVVERANPATRKRRVKFLGVV
ncbi:hypothetical protein F5B20DRAFT_579580 [Whalleya microplaca]|nr:hypothetical protein F5B20DRAFT_579580 [Whalleya microplaca]